MPGMSGLELQAHLNAERLQIPTNLHYGTWRRKNADAGMREGAVEFLAKPFSTTKALLIVFEQPWKVDPSNGSVHPGSQEVSMENLCGGLRKIGVQ